MLVAELHAHGGGLEQQPALVLEHRDPAQRVPGEVCVAFALIAVEDLQLIGLVDLLQHPDDAQRAAGFGAVIDEHWAADDTRGRPAGSPGRGRRYGRRGPARAARSAPPISARASRAAVPAIRMWMKP